MSDRFDFEQQITRCWFIVDDLKEFDEMIFEEYVKIDKDSLSNHILGIANAYDVKFHKLWHLYETVFIDIVKENKMLNEECAALREQLGHGAGKNFQSGAGQPSLFGVCTDIDEDGFAVIKSNKKGKK
jgi:hypothetical protein